MAVRYEDECVCCPKEMGCIGSACQYKNVPYYSCDKCGADEELDGVEIYEYDGNHYCPSCLLELFPKVSAV